MSGTCDPAMLELFRAEMDTHVPALSEGLLALEKGRAGDQDLEAMMRAAHSIKGAARIVGIEAAVRVAHAMEDCFSAAQKHELTLSSEAVDVLLQGVDTLQRICSPEPDPAMTEPSIQALLERIAAVRESKSSTSSGRPKQQLQLSPVAVLQATADLVQPETRLTLPAVFDAGAAESFRSRFSDSLHPESARIRLDFSQVRHLSTAALALLASFSRELGKGDPAPAVEAEGVATEMAVLLRITGLDNTFTRRE